jgi:hypothetical protein
MARAPMVRKAIPHTQSYNRNAVQGDWLEARPPLAGAGSDHLFVDDEELRRRFNPKMGRDRFRSALRALESRYPDFPRIHSLFRGRYWPAVRAWLDDEHGVLNNGRITTAQDGPEAFDAPAQRSSRVKVAHNS